MKTVKFINPEGAEVEVPEADAAHFDKMGWKRTKENTKSGKDK